MNVANSFRMLKHWEESRILSLVTLAIDCHVGHFSVKFTVSSLFMYVMSPCVCAIKKMQYIPVYRAPIGAPMTHC